MQNDLLNLDHVTLGNILSFMSPADIDNVRRISPDLEEFITWRFVRPAAIKSIQYFLARGLSYTKNRDRRVMMPVKRFQRADMPSEGPAEGIVQVLAQEFHVSMTDSMASSIGNEPYLLIQKFVTYRRSGDPEPSTESSWIWWNRAEDPYAMDAFIGDISDPYKEPSQPFVDFKPHTLEVFMPEAALNALSRKISNGL